MDIYDSALTGDLERVRALVEQDAETVHAQCASGRTPLQRAALCGHSAVVAYLVARDADVNHRDQHGFTALHDACSGGHAAVVSILLQRGADVRAVIPNTGLNALVLAVSYGSDALVRVLLEHGGSDVNAIESHGQTVLHLACLEGYDGVVMQLLEAGADPSLRDVDGRTAVDLAELHGRRNCVKVVQEWYRAYTLYRARSVHEASLIAANSSAHVDAAPTYLVDRATSGLTMPTMHLSPNQQHAQSSDDVVEEGHVEVGPVAVGGVVTVYAMEQLNGEVFTELMELMGTTGCGIHEAEWR